MSNVAVTGGRIVVDNGLTLYVNPAGDFSGPMLPQGKYLLTAFLDVQGRRISGQSTVELGTANVTDARIVIAPVPDVSGRVVIENRPGGAAADIGRVQVGLTSTVATTLDVKPQPGLCRGRVHAAKWNRRRLCRHCFPRV
jgi:hypothetical protein